MNHPRLWRRVAVAGSVLALVCTVFWLSRIFLFSPSPRWDANLVEPMIRNLIVCLLWGISALHPSLAVLQPFTTLLNGCGQAVESPGSLTPVISALLTVGLVLKYGWLKGRERQLFIAIDDS